MPGRLNQASLMLIRAEAASAPAAQSSPQRPKRVRSTQKLLGSSDFVSNLNSLYALDINLEDLARREGAKATLAWRNEALVQR